MSVNTSPALDLNAYVYPYYDLGVTYGPQQSSFKLWAPTAKTVSIALFDNATNEASKNIPMQSDANGIWSATVSGNLDGKYYLYEITHGTNSLSQLPHRDYEPQPGALSSPSPPRSGDLSRLGSGERNPTEGGGPRGPSERERASQQGRGEVALRAQRENPSIDREGSGERPVRVLDPYARGSSANSGRALIYDSRKTNPDGWDTDTFIPLKNNVDAVLYEVHVRDFSINRNSGISETNRGKYLGMVEAGTKSPEGEKTGMDHLKELGITHVHLLPVNDYAPGDETQKADEYTWYNWGYGPVLFNTPEGSYASDPDGTARQREFKRMVQAFHRNHIGVVIDVVYNHTAGIGHSRYSIFDKILPHYYYRTDAAGHYANATDCGNEFASEKPMARKFIVDSIEYWLREYHVDGFRFDLMGALDRETILEAFRAAKEINPSVIFYGEGWSIEHLLPPEQMMTQRYLQGTGIAAFNDGIRDNIKGDAHNAAAPGFVQGARPPYGGMERFWLNIKGESTGKGDGGITVVSPNETINYDSCHDDHCLWDKLLLSAPNVPEQQRINMDKLAAGIVLTAQGVPFIHAGDEFLRSKNLNRNSYNDLVVNPIDWSLKAKQRDVFDFYRGMIALRRAHPAFRITDHVAVERALEFAKVAPPNLVEYVIKDHANGDSWKNILVIYNGSKEPRALNIAGHWSIVADENRAGTDVLRTSKNTISVQPFSLIVAFTEGAYHLDGNR